MTNSEVMNPPLNSLTSLSGNDVFTVRHNLCVQLVQKNAEISLKPHAHRHVEQQFDTDTKCRM